VTHVNVTSSLSLRSFGDTSTSGLLVAMLDFRQRSTSGDVGIASSRRTDPKNVGVAVGISTISVVVSEILVLPVCWRPCWISGSDVGSAVIRRTDPKNVGAAVGISTISVVVSEILVLAVCWRLCWISGRGRRRATSALPPVDSSTRKSGCSRWNFDDICRSFLDTSISGLLAAMLDFRQRSTMCDVGIASNGRGDPEQRM